MLLVYQASCQHLMLTNSHKAYTSAASFVPQLTSKVVSWLAVSPTDHILDIGCGDGPLTAQLAQSASSGHVLGLDASASMISTAQHSHGSANCTFRVQDCRRIADDPEAVNGQWDKVFSNAALHWILRDPTTRRDVFAHVHRALKPGGVFVFEMGGKGNVAEVHAATIAALLAHGVAIEEARGAMAWFFPSEAWMREALETAGFAVERMEMEYRPTKLTPRSADGSGGLEGWVQLMCAQMLEAVEETRRAGVVRQIVETLQSVVTREEDGSQYIGYVRLRAMARKQ